LEQLLNKRLLDGIGAGIFLYARAEMPLPVSMQWFSKVWADGLAIYQGEVA
jgi:hypothetical protein